MYFENKTESLSYVESPTSNTPMSDREK